MRRGSRVALCFAAAIYDHMVNARFLKPMECLPVNKLPTIPGWTYEIKLDGFRCEAVRFKDHITLYSRQEKVLTPQFQQIAKELSECVPPDTVLDGELVALDDQGSARFNLLQNLRSGLGHLFYFVFDVLVHGGRDVMRLPLSARRALLQSTINRGEHVQAAEWTSEVQSLECFVRERKLEGIVAKRSDSVYLPDTRSGSWVKVRFTCRQEFVIGGYTPSHLGLDALLVGVYEGSELRLTGSVRAGFNPHSRREAHDQIKHLEIAQCPFVNLPDKRVGQWGQGVTAPRLS